MVKSRYCIPDSLPFLGSWQFFLLSVFTSHTPLHRPPHLPSRPINPSTRTSFQGIQLVPRFRAFNSYLVSGQGRSFRGPPREFREKPLSKLVERSSHSPCVTQRCTGYTRWGGDTTQKSSPRTSTDKWCVKCSTYCTHQSIRNTNLCGGSHR